MEGADFGRLSLLLDVTAAKLIPGRMLDLIEGKVGSLRIAASSSAASLEFDESWVPRTLGKIAGMILATFGKSYLFLWGRCRSCLDIHNCISGKLTLKYNYQMNVQNVDN